MCSQSALFPSAPGSRWPALKFVLETLLGFLLYFSTKRSITVLVVKERQE